MLWNAIVLLKTGKIYLIGEMWWNILDSTPTLILFYLSECQFKFIYQC